MSFAGIRNDVKIVYDQHNVGQNRIQSFQNKRTDYVSILIGEIVTCSSPAQKIEILYPDSLVPGFKAADRIGGAKYCEEKSATTAEACIGPEDGGNHCSWGKFNCVPKAGQAASDCSQFSSDSSNNRTAEGCLANGKCHWVQTFWPSS